MMLMKNTFQKRIIAITHQQRICSSIFWKQQHRQQQYFLSLLSSSSQQDDVTYSRNYHHQQHQQQNCLDDDVQQTTMMTTTMMTPQPSVIGKSFQKRCFSSMTQMSSSLLLSSSSSRIDHMTHRRNNSSTSRPHDNNNNIFSHMSSRWWDPMYNPLIHMNTIRIEYIKQMIQQYYHMNNDNIDAHKNNNNNTMPTYRSETFTSILPLNGLSILDIGCGGGLLCESLARLGASNVIGIDPSTSLINAAKEHASVDDILSKKITYIDNITAEQLINEPNNYHKNGYDIVCCLEVIEHVNDQKSLIAAASQLCKPNGLLFISTINRTMKSYVVTILGAEYIMKYLPTGTHQWNKYVSPNEVYQYMNHNNNIKSTFGSSSSHGQRHNNDNNVEEPIIMKQLNVTGMVLQTPTSSPSKILEIITPSLLHPLLPLSNNNINKSTTTTTSSSSLHHWDWKLDPNDIDVNWIACYRRIS